MQFGMLMNVHHLNIKPYRALDNCAQGSHDFTKGIRHNGKTDGLALLLDRERLNFTQGQIQKPQRFQKSTIAATRVYNSYCAPPLSIKQPTQFNDCLPPCFILDKSPQRPG
jgi:hypothetical protein